MNFKLSSCLMTCWLLFVDEDYDVISALNYRRKGASNGENDSFQPSFKKGFRYAIMDDGFGPNWYNGRNGRGSETKEIFEENDQPIWYNGRSGREENMRNALKLFDIVTKARKFRKNDESNDDY
eukprot:gene34-625_t